jgi:CheY-like chemotaxis protein
VSGQPAPLRIVVADDQASVREGLVLLLGLLPGIEVVASAADGRQAIDLVTQHRPDAILLDLSMPVIDGIEATRQLTELHPEVAIVVLTTYADDTSILAALSAGARSYLTKDAGRAEIASTRIKRANRHRRRRCRREACVGWSGRMVKDAGDAFLGHPDSGLPWSSTTTMGIITAFLHRHLDGS